MASLVQRKWFESFDSDGDGRLSAADVGAILQESGYRAEPDYIDEIMTLFDRNRNGGIEVSEFKTLWEHLELGRRLGPKAMTVLGDGWRSGLGTRALPAPQLRANNIAQIRRVSAPLPVLVPMIMAWTMAASLRVLQGVGVVPRVQSVGSSGRYYSGSSRWMLRSVLGTISSTPLI